VLGEWNFPERQSGGNHRRIEDVIDGGLDHQGDEAFGDGDDGKKNDACAEAKGVWAHVGQQPFELW
jgi:hypothetical protein